MQIREKSKVVTDDIDCIEDFFHSIQIWEQVFSKLLEYIYIYIDTE